jgi:hypothetical protein
MHTQTTILVITVFIIIAFTLWRYSHYLGDRENGHDEYMTLRSEDGSKYKKCADMSMMGFKWSTVLFLVGINTALTLYLLSIHK